MGLKEQSEHLINRNLTALMAVIFLFYGGLSCLYSTFIPHMLELGFTQSEIRIILTTVALISVIGPLLLGPLIDRIADRRKSSYGRYLQLILATLLILGAIAYGLLLLAPPVRRSPSREPSVSFGCDSSGAIIFQERCSEERTCFHWEKEKIGSLVLTNCSYTCQNPTQFENLYNPWLKGSPQPPEQQTSREKPDEYDYDESSQVDDSRQRRDVGVAKVYVEPPHLCTKKVNATGHSYIDRCHVYTNDLEALQVQATLRGAINLENETHSAEWCNYPLGKEDHSPFAGGFFFSFNLSVVFRIYLSNFVNFVDGFECNIPSPQVNYMKAVMNNPNCKPMIECEVSDPYSNPSVLAQSRCYKVSSTFVLFDKPQFN